MYVCMYVSLSLPPLAPSLLLPLSPSLYQAQPLIFTHTHTHTGAAADAGSRHARIAAPNS